MKTKDAQINRLVLENAKLKSEAARAVQPCRTCEYLKRHDCWTMYECPYLGIVNPDGPGCQKHKGGTNGKLSAEENRGGAAGGL